ncbi:hypothetical protein [Pseudomonas umsongensis]|uniref:DUF4376 domain-containing protein n=1 Tax=Pseudomonas umsongensis TaxID=198618 RepID=UPI0003626E04|nr:hypothetical protein [Pseudomonas umsongensis]
MTVIYLIHPSGILEGPVELPIVPGLGTQLPFNALELNKVLPPARVGHTWCVVNGVPEELADLRGEVYDTTTGEPSQFTQLGDLPEGLTDIPRPTPTHRWQAGAWAQDASSLHAAKTADINGQCEGAITTGFWSSALGARHLYSSQLDDQLNLMGVIVSGLDSPYACRDEQGVKAFRPHTQAQVRRVWDEFTLFKLQLLQRANNLKQQLDLALAVGDCDAMAAVTWSDSQS